jgi:hypothetical protein
LGLAQCSLSPLSGGGTETGNPGMLECARAVFEQVDSVGRWSVENYLPGGEQQLNPNCLLNQKPVAPLGKVAAVSQDTQVIIRDSSIIVINLARYDTVVIVDTVYSYEPEIKNVVVYDTVRPALQAPESSVVVIEKIGQETISTVDTVVNRDTTKVPRYDTLVFPLTDSAAVFQSYGRYYIVGPIYSFGTIAFRDVAYIQLVPEWGVNSDLGSSSYLALSRTAQVQGTTVFEKYSSADNDGLLFGPDSSLLTNAQYNTYTKNVPPSRVLLAGDYTDTADARKTTLSVLFDAGLDYQVATSADNRILSLSRAKTVDGQTIEQATYSTRAVDSVSASPVLALKISSQSGILDSQSVRFSFLPGSDSLDQRQNRIDSISNVRWYHSGGLQALSVQVKMAAPATAPAWTLRGQVNAQLFFNGSGNGLFSGTVDKSAGTLSGVYTANGVEHWVTYSKSTNRLEWYGK